jgi:hypothetical protein
MPSYIKVKFFCCGVDYDGFITNISGNGMFISSGEVSFPFDSEFKIAFPLEDEVLNIPVKVSRLLKTGDIYDGMGVEILKPSKQYLVFLDKLKCPP